MASDPHAGLKSFAAGQPSIHIRPLSKGFHVALHDGGDNVSEHHAPSLQNASDIGIQHIKDMNDGSVAMGGGAPGTPAYIPPAAPVAPAPVAPAAAPTPAPAAPANTSSLLNPQSRSNLT